MYQLKLLHRKVTFNFFLMYVRTINLKINILNALNFSHNKSNTLKDPSILCEESNPHLREAYFRHNETIFCGKNPIPSNNMHRRNELQIEKRQRRNRASQNQSQIAHHTQSLRNENL